MDGPGGPDADRGPTGWRPAGLEHRPEFATLIANPKAGRGRVGRELAAVEAAMHRHGFGFRLDLTRGRGDATRLGREALGRGERFLVAVGGDGTVNEVLNAMIDGDRPVDEEAVLGVLAANSGCDAVRSFGLSQDPETAVARFEVGNVYTIDVGKATVVARDGERSRYFLNMAQAGLGGAASARAARLPGFFRGSRSFFGYWLAMAGYRRPAVTLHGDRREFEGRITNLLVANLQFGGNGMLLSPRSWPEDGYLDLQVFTGPKSESFTLLPKMFQGEHLPNPSITEYRSKAVRLEADRPVWVEADGEPIGRTPATFEAVPSVLRLKV
jgi:YegS/Rv2252/BmrU family lipid kinase